MPIQVSLEQFPDGRRYGRTVSTGKLSGRDADEINRRTAPGGDLEGAPLLSVMEGSVEMDPEARKAFSAMNAASAKSAKQPKIALVTPNAPMRVMLSFVLRITGSGGHMKFFSNEAEALAWLAKD